MQDTFSATELTLSDLIKIYKTGELNGVKYYNNGYRDISLTNCTFVDDVILKFMELMNNDYSNARSIMFKDCFFIKPLTIYRFSPHHAIVFNNCVFENVANFYEIDGHFKFENQCHFKREFSFSPGIIKSFEAYNVVVESDIIFSGTWDIRISLGYINVVDNKITNKGSLKFQNSTIKEIDLKQSGFSLVSVINSNLSHETNIDGLHAENFISNNTLIGLTLNFANSKVNDLSIDNTRKSSHRYLNLKENCTFINVSLPIGMLDKISIDNCNVQLLKLWGVNQSESIINIQNSRIDNLLFDEIYNKGLITLRNLGKSYENPNLTIGITSSNLGKTDFILCDFSNSKFVFENSKIAEVFLSETDFPKEVYCASKVDNAQGRLAFGQLHTAFQKQGDTVRALEYQAREIEAHYNQLKERKALTFTSKPVV